MVTLTVDERVYARLEELAAARGLSVEQWLEDVAGRGAPEGGRDRERARLAVDRLKTMRGTIQGVTLDELIITIHEGHRF